jgi:D-alanine-D-alanine ligase
MHPTLVPPASREGFSERESHAWKTEYDVVTTLRDVGHQVEPLGVQYELAPIRDRVAEGKPDVVFNLLEEFHGVVEFDHHVVSYLELLQVRYTGCNPRGLVLARDKALAKKLCIYHRIRVPAFAVFPRGHRVRRPRRLGFPLIVKSVSQEASVGIAQASIVDSEEKLAERVAFVHETIQTDAIAEQFIEGRELYVGLLGNRRLQVLPTWELVFENLPPGSAAIATARAKHDPEYQRKRGIFQKPADDLPPALQARIASTSRRVCRILELDGYARIDYRLGADGEVYFLEANPNPEIARSEEFAAAAEAAGLPYPKLLQRIVNLGLQREPR